MKPARGFVISTLLYIVIMVIVAALFISFGYKFIYKSGISPNPSSQTPPDVQEQKADTVDETANWKTYQSTLIKFQIKYPENIKIDELPGQVVFYFGTKKNVPKGSILDPYPYTSLSIEARGKDFLAEPQGFAYSEKLIDTKVANYPAFLIDRQHTSIYWIYTSDKQNSVRVDVFGKDNKEVSLVFLKILSTFKFTD